MEVRSPCAVLLRLALSFGLASALCLMLAVTSTKHAHALQAWTIVSKAYVDSEFGGHEWEGELSQVAALPSCAASVSVCPLLHHHAGARP